MTDPLGLIGNTGPLQPARAPGLPRPSAGQPVPSFRDLLQEQIAQVNELQRGAREAVEDLATGRRDDVETVMIAMQKADSAFRMLLQIRNKMMDAYEEVKQIRI